LGAAVLGIAIVLGVGVLIGLLLLRDERNNQLSSNSKKLKKLREELSIAHKDKRSPKQLALFTYLDE